MCIRDRINTPPNADIGSEEREDKNESFRESLDEKPHALLCLNIPNTKFLELNSDIRLTAESISIKLLYETFLPFNCSNESSIDP